MADKLFSDIAKGAELKAVETVDKSTPQIDETVHIKKVDRTGFLSEVKKGADLKHAETVDKAAPVIDSSVHIEESKRPALLAEIKGKATE